MKSPKFDRPAALFVLTILAACASRLPTIDPGIPTTLPSVNGKPVACSEFEIIHASTGKPGGATVQDVQDALQKPDPIGHVRNVVGDTTKTLAQVREHNAGYRALCDGSPIR